VSLVHGGKVEIDGMGFILFARRVPDQEELPTVVVWDCHNATNPQPFSELVLSPSFSLIEGVLNVVDWLFVVDDDDDGSRVAEFPHMCVLVDFFPGEASVAGKESIRVLVRSKGFSNISDSEHKSDNRRAGEGRSRIPSFGIPMDM
jgi:hypothetical protein